MTGAMATAVRNRGEALALHGIPFSRSAPAGKSFNQVQKSGCENRILNESHQNYIAHRHLTQNRCLSQTAAKKQSYCNCFVLVTARLGGPERMLQRNGWILFFGRFASPWSVWPRRAASSARAPRCLSLSD